jgi:hypothetical protein
MSGSCAYRHSAQAAFLRLTKRPSLGCGLEQITRDPSASSVTVIPPYHLRFVLRGVYLETRFDQLLLDLYTVGTVTRPLHSEKRQAWCFSSCWLRLLFALEFSPQQTNAAVGRVPKTYRHCRPSYSNLST